MKILNVKGKQCPLPLIETKKALNEMGGEAELKVITDSETAKNNVTRFLNDNDIQSEWSENDQVYEILINHRGGDLEQADAEAYCSPANAVDSDFVVVFTKDYLGEGSEELGRILMNGFLDTLIADENFPKKLMFFNSAVLMTLKGSAQIDMLRELEEAGMEILVCGTCLDYYKKTNELAVGKVSNMLEIQTSMIEAGKVLNF
jgi:selenium metabolism protein YedF